MRMNQFQRGRGPQPWQRHYRIRKDEQGHGGGASAAAQGGGESSQQQNNEGGNSAQGGGESNSNNNGGNKFDPASFWNSPPAETSQAPQPGGSAAGGTQAGGQQQQQQETPAARLATDLGSLDFGVPVMSDVVMKDLADGKMESFQEAMTNHGRSVAQHTMRLAVGLMGQLRDQLRSEFQDGISSGFNERDTSNDLVAAIPSAANPAVRPQVEQLLKQSLVHTKGDRKAAIQMTKEMLAFTAKTMGGDIGLPPPSPGDSTGLTPSNTNWLEELTGRS